MKMASFWIQVHDLPLMARKECIIRVVCVVLCMVEEVDLDYGEVEWG